MVILESPGMSRWMYVGGMSSPSSEVTHSEAVSWERCLSLQQRSKPGEECKT